MVDEMEKRDEDGRVARASSPVDIAIAWALVFLAMAGLFLAG